MHQSVHFQWLSESVVLIMNVHVNPLEEYFLNDLHSFLRDQPMWTEATAGVEPFDAKCCYFSASFSSPNLKFGIYQRILQ